MRDNLPVFSHPRGCAALLFFPLNGTLEASRCLERGRLWGDGPAKPGLVRSARPLE